MVRSVLINATELETASCLAVTVITQFSVDRNCLPPF